MTFLLWLALTIAVAAVSALVLRRRAVRSRWRRLLRDPLPPLRGHSRRRDRGWRSVLPELRAGALARRRPAALLTALGVAAVCFLAGQLVSGPIAGAMLAAYGALGVVLALRSVRKHAQALSRRAAVDAVAALAADLRAGLAVGAALGAAAGSLDGPAVIGEDAATVARRVASAVELAESSGAPLADVLDRLDAHLRAIDRARATVAAQAAGARASALLLAAMPVAGIGLGFGIGIDPLHVLLHTPLGAACLFGSAVLQLAGLAWAGRLSRVQVPA